MGQLLSRGFCRRSTKCEAGNSREHDSFDAVDATGAASSNNASPANVEPQTPRHSPTKVPSDAVGARLLGDIRELQDQVAAADDADAAAGVPAPSTPVAAAVAVDLPAGGTPPQVGKYIMARVPKGQSYDLQVVGIANTTAKSKEGAPARPPGPVLPFEQHVEACLTSMELAAELAKQAKHAASSTPPSAQHTP